MQKLKNSFLLLTFLYSLIPSILLAQDAPGMQNEALKILASGAGTSTKLSTDKYGRLMTAVSGPQTGIPALATGAVCANNDTAETGSTVTSIVATAHVAKVGDIVEFQTGATRYGTSYVVAVATNSFTIYPPLPAAPANGDFFYICRATVPQVNSGGWQQIDITTTAQANNAVGILKLEDAASANADAGVSVFGVRTDTLAASAGTTGDYEFIETDSLGAVWVRPAPNQDVTASLITCAGCTTTQTGADQLNYSGKCAFVVLDMTTVGTGSVTLEIDGKDVVSGKYVALLTGVAVTTISTNTYQLCPGVTVAANAAVSSALPKTWRIKVTANNANATTYTVGASIIE